LARAWSLVEGSDVHVNVVTSDAQQVASEGLSCPEKSTVLGPVQVIPREFPGVSVSLLDIPAGPNAQTSKSLTPVLEEVFATPGTAIAAVRDGRRYQQDWVRYPLSVKALAPMSKGAVVLITGGLGGMGLALAKRMAQHCAARIGLVSHRQFPPRTAWDKTLRARPHNDRTAQRIRDILAIEKAGGEVQVLEADVCNPTELSAAVEAMRAAWGKVHGVIHAAGAIDDGPILAKDPSSVDRVLSAKVQGTDVLSQIFPDGALEWMVLCSSASTATAPAGQVDYVAANAYLNAVAQSRKGGKTRVLAIDWGVWSDVGMAAQAMADRVPQTKADYQNVVGPLLDTHHVDAGGTHVFLASWSAKNLWVLDEHRTRAGDALLPGTGYFELAAQALEALGFEGQFQVLDLTFLSPAHAVDGGETTIRLSLTPTDQGFKMSVESALDGCSFTTTASATLQTLPMLSPASVKIAKIATRMTRVVKAQPGETLRLPQAPHLAFGARWQVLTAMRFGDGEGLADLCVPQVDQGYHLHPALLDIATGWAVELIDGYTPDQFWVPVSYETARFFGQLPHQVKSWVRYDAQGSGSDIARFDVMLMAPDGVVCAQIKGFTLHRLSRDIRFAAASNLPANSAMHRQLSPAEQRLVHNVSQGIQPEDGATAFLATLATDVSQVLVSSLDLDGLIAQVKDDTAPAVGSVQTFERPDLAGDYIEPEGEIERRLAEFWTELLGIQKIGAEDDFFDLGGHSLIAVRLFARIKSAFAVDFPISVLFEAPTLRTCAQLIEEHGVNPQGTAPPSIPTQAAASRFTHLVPMHPREGGQNTPFFLVAGMFGNVLNLRHLAQSIGQERPIYGVQAKGLLGGDAPHCDLRQAARDYIAEIRQVRPKGPYLLGGFSGGGLTAYEMAHQLRQDDDEVAALILLDTPLPQRMPLTRADKVGVHWLRFKEYRHRYLWHWVKRRIQWEVDSRKAVAPENSPVEFHNTAIEQAFLEAIGAYQVLPWSGPITLFRPKLDLKYEVRPGRFINSARELVDEANFWRPHAENLKVVEVPGDHDTMVLEPNVRVLAKALKAILAASEAEADDLLRAAE
ncbi:MAG: SDR family NAD(P)-dependent oxidoreductase, partial [Pseudomonadota bacterium]